MFNLLKEKKRRLGNSENSLQSKEFKLRDKVLAP
jgi:hypothetical protein